MSVYITIDDQLTIYVRIKPSLLLDCTSIDILDILDNRLAFKNVPSFKFSKVITITSHTLVIEGVVLCRLAIWYTSSIVCMQCTDVMISHDHQYLW